MADVPTARSEVTVAQVKGKIYVLGGFGRGAAANEEYDPATNNWLDRSPMAAPREHIGLAVFDERIFVFGGRLETFARNLTTTE